MRFCGFSHDEDEWVNVRRGLRERSIPLEPSECHKVKVGDLLLCYRVWFTFFFPFVGCTVIIFCTKIVIRENSMNETLYKTGGPSIVHRWHGPLLCSYV